MLYWSWYCLMWIIVVFLRRRRIHMISVLEVRRCKVEFLVKRAYCTVVRSLYEHLTEYPIRRLIIVHLLALVLARSNMSTGNVRVGATVVWLGGGGLHSIFHLLCKHFSFQESRSMLSKICYHATLVQLFCALNQICRKNLYQLNNNSKLIISLQTCC